jgi:DNA-binding MarR family transcriptional regulator
VNESAPPQWLTADQKHTWIAVAAMMVWLPATLDEQLQKDAGVSFAEYTVLSWLSMRPERSARMSDIAELANVRLSHLSRIAARLEQRGWMTRERDPRDGRGTIARLTDAGWAKMVAIAPGHVEEVRRLIFDNLSADEAAGLRTAAEQIVAAARPGLSLPSPED